MNYFISYSWYICTFDYYNVETNTLYYFVDSFVLILLLIFAQIIVTLNFLCIIFRLLNLTAQV